MAMIPDTSHRYRSSEAEAAKAMRFLIRQGLEPAKLNHVDQKTRDFNQYSRGVFDTISGEILRLTGFDPKMRVSITKGGQYHQDLTGCTVYETLSSGYKLERRFAYTNRDTTETIETPDISRLFLVIPVDQNSPGYHYRPELGVEVLEFRPPDPAVRNSAPLHHINLAESQDTMSYEALYVIARALFNKQLPKSIAKHSVYS